MEAAPGIKAVDRLRFVSRLGAYLVSGYAVVALIGWFAKIPALTSGKAGLASTSIATATCFLLSAFAVHSLTDRLAARRTRVLLWRGGAVIVVIIGLYVLAGYVTGRADAGYLLGRNLGRVSPATAACFILLAAAALSADYRRGRISAGLTALGLVIAGLDLVGYVYGIKSLYEVLPFSSMALPTALSFAILFVALLLARPCQGWLQYAVRDDRVGYGFRVLLPAVIIIPFAIAYLLVRANDYDLFDSPFAFALFAIATTVILGALVIFVSAWMARATDALRHAEDERRHNAQMLEAAMDAAQLGAWISNLALPGDAKGRLEWTAGAYRIFGVARSEFDQRVATFTNLVHPDDRAAVAEAYREAFDRDRPSRIVYRVVRPDKAVRWVEQHARALRDGSGAATQIVGVIQDVTETRLVEQQLVQAQKMEAVGNLTGGMAHDFNNLLGVIIGNLDLLQPKFERDADAKELFGDALDAAIRGADLTRRLLAFARRQPLQPKRAEPNELVANIVNLLRRTLGETVEISLDLSPDIWPLMVDPAQLEASIVNLANNARDAMPKGGRLSIATANRTLDADYASLHAEVAAGDYVMIEVSDTGGGMPPHIMDHVFEPFFTTKGPGKGTGLGLSMVFGFMKQSGGHINVYSEPGVGTTFRLYLPRADALEEAASGLTAEPRAPGGNETVLVVEDNEAMRRIVVRQLAELGYHVVEAENAAAARDLLAKQSVDVLFTDIVMAGEIDGVELARAAIALQPSLKVLLTSGFPGANLNGQAEAMKGMRLLSKPYRRDDLARAFRDVLGG